jgi:hypothetical protein
VGFLYPSHWGDDADSTSITSSEGDSVRFSTPFVARMEDRDRYLEDYLNGLGSGGFLFDFPGSLVVSISDPLPATSQLSFSGIVFALAGQSSLQVVVEVDINGISIGTNATIPASTSVYNWAQTIAVPQYSVIQLRIVSPGDGGAGLVGVPY